MAILKTKIALVSIAVIVIILVVVYLQHFGLFANGCRLPSSENSFNSYGLCFAYPANWTLVSYNYSNTSTTMFSALLMPSYLVSSLVYPNKSMIPTPNVTAFSEVNIIITSNISESKLYSFFIFNESSITNATTMGGYKATRAVEYIAPSTSMPIPAESITYLSSGNNIGYVVGAFFSTNINTTTSKALEDVTTTLRYVR